MNSITAVADKSRTRLRLQTMRMHRYPVTKS